MSKEKPANDVEEASDELDEATADEENGASEPEEVLDPLEQKEKELEEIQNEMLRMRAETENFRKRLGKEKEDSVRYANERLFKDLVPIYDNLLRALEAPDINVKSLKEGVDLIGKQFLSFMERHNVRPIDAIGKTFDPNLHEVLSQIESGDHEEGTIVDEFGKGYWIHDRVLIPSKVVTSKKP